MKANFDRKFSDPMGQEIPNAASMKEQLALTLFTYGNDQNANVPADKKYQAYRLSMAIAKGGETELTTEDASLIKEAANKAFAAGFYGQVVDAIENN